MAPTRYTDGECNSEHLGHLFRRDSHSEHCDYWYLASTSHNLLLGVDYDWNRLVRRFLHLFSRQPLIQSAMMGIFKGHSFWGFVPVQTRSNTLTHSGERICVCSCHRTTEVINPTMNYQLILCRSRKKLPVGPPFGSVASQTAVPAPSAGVLGAPAPPMRVRTQPGQTAFTRTLSFLSS